MIAREVDFPPVWLAGFAAVGAIVGRYHTLHFRFSTVSGAGLVVFALALMIFAVLQMVWARTTVIPGRNPTHLVTGGVFRFSRNPIYLADALLLLGLYVYWGAVIALPCVALFMLLISNRFIKPEEAAMARLFGEEFEIYKNRTRRWI